ncbi:MAG: hypothetical protein SPL39_09210 [Selenomonadaceae bacterium]|nr:hypothetical protein [Selenomonadaceae bacterium]
MKANRKRRHAVFAVGLGVCLGCMTNVLVGTFVPATCNCAEAQTITVEGVYALQDPLEKIQEAKERARQEAMRSALEQAGVYVSSYSEAHHLALTEDEIETRASGILHVEQEHYTTSIENASTVVYHCALTVTLDLDHIMTAEPNSQIIAYAAGRKQQDLQQELEQKKALLEIQKQQVERVSRKSYEQAITPEMVQKFQAQEVQLQTSQQKIRTSSTPHQMAAQILAKDQKDLVARYQLSQASQGDTAEEKAAYHIAVRTLWEMLHEMFTEDEYYAMVIPLTAPGQLLDLDFTGSHLVTLRQTLSLSSVAGETSLQACIQQEAQGVDGKTVTLAVRPYDLTEGSLAKAHQVLGRHQQFLEYQQMGKGNTKS